MVGKKEAKACKATPGKCILMKKALSDKQIQTIKQSSHNYYETWTTLNSLLILVQGSEKVWNVI